MPLTPDQRIQLITRYENAVRNNNLAEMQAVDSENPGAIPSYIITRNLENSPSMDTSVDVTRYLVEQAGRYGSEGQRAINQAYSLTFITENDAARRAVIAPAVDQEGRNEALVSAVIRGDYRDLPQLMNGATQAGIDDALIRVSGARSTEGLLTLRALAERASDDALTQRLNSTARWVERDLQQPEPNDRGLRDNFRDMSVLIRAGAQVNENVAEILRDNPELASRGRADIGRAVERPAGRVIQMAYEGQSVEEARQQRDARDAAEDRVMTADLRRAGPSTQSTAPASAVRMDRDDMREMQASLQGLGYDVGRAGADGLMGRDTANAIRQFERDQGLQADGRIDSAMLNALRQAKEAGITNSVSGGQEVASAQASTVNGQGQSQGGGRGA